LAAVALAGLLAWCWRRNRSQHTAAYNTHSTSENQSRGPTRIVVTEKIEPVVVKSGTHQTYNNDIPANTPTTYTTTTQSVPVNQGHSNSSTTYNTGSSTVHPSTSYNTTTAARYNTANNEYTSRSNSYNSG
jgi:FtsZ-interacting cell division protein ZipA